MRTRSTVSSRIYRYVAGAAAALVTASVCAACGGSTGATGDAKTLKLGIWYDFPKPYQNGSAWMNFAAFYDPIVRQVPGTYDVKPALATSYTYNDARTVLTLKIRHGVTFSDGTPVNAKTIAANINWGRDPKSGSLVTAWLSAIKSVSVKSSDEVEVDLSKPDSGLLPLGLSQPVVSPAAFDRKNLAQNPDGSGPYVLQKSGTTAGVQYTATRRKGYWDADNYKYDSVVYKILKDPTAMVNALRSGQIDVGWLKDNSGAVGSLKGAGFHVAEYSAEWYGLILGDSAGKKSPPMAKVKVRQAINMAFDRAAIVKAVEGGQAIADAQTFGTSSPAYVRGGNERYAYNVAKAKQLLAEAGYPNGFSVTIPFVAGLDYAPIVKQSLGDIGIRVTIKDDSKVDQSQFLADYFKNPLPIVFFPGDPFTHFIPDALIPGGFLNGWKRTDPTLSSLLDKISAASTESDRNAQSQLLGKWLLDNAWFAVLAHIPMIFASAKSVALPSVGDDNGPPLSMIRPAT